MILQAVLVLECFHANVARETRSVVIVNREMLRKAGRQSEALCAYGTLECFVVVIHFVVFKSVLALKALVALLALVDLIVVHDLVLLESNQRRKEFVTNVADLSGAWSMLRLMVLKSILAFELLVALRRMLSIRLEHE